MAIRKLRKGYVFVGKDGKSNPEVTQIDDRDPLFVGQEHKFHPVESAVTVPPISADDQVDPVAESPVNRAIPSAPKKRSK